MTFQPQQQASPHTTTEAAHTRTPHTTTEAARTRTPTTVSAGVVRQNNIGGVRNVGVVKSARYVHTAYHVHDIMPHQNAPHLHLPWHLLQQCEGEGMGEGVEQCNGTCGGRGRGCLWTV